MKDKELKEKLIANKRDEWQDIGLDGNIADEMAREEVEDMTNEEMMINLEDLTVQ